MKIRTNVKAGALVPNHNEALAVKSQVKAGGSINHNEGLAVKSQVKAGGLGANHNETLAH
jgi:hypothetical protein